MSEFLGSENHLVVAVSQLIQAFCKCSLKNYLCWEYSYFPYIFQASFEV